MSGKIPTRSFMESRARDWPSVRAPARIGFDLAIVDSAFPRLFGLTYRLVTRNYVEG